MAFRHPFDGFPVTYPYPSLRTISAPSIWTTIVFDVRPGDSAWNSGDDGGDGDDDVEANVRVRSNEF